MTRQLVDWTSKCAINSQGLKEKKKEAAIKQIEESWQQQKFPMTNPSNTTSGWDLAEHNKLKEVRCILGPNLSCTEVDKNKHSERVQLTGLQL
jgi:hypothetical protein